ncbi:MAG TPA: glycosyltransferase family 39 protein [Candidatus Omnitrophota bacterium]|nr:glycosyltransferase family 39 protein [Candidatus Omnitrophota bacterium]
MGILQATTTQNDLVLSFWVVSFVYFLFQTIKNNNRSILPYVFLGLSVGIGFLTKATMIFFIVSFCSLGVLHLLCKREFKKYLKGFVIVFSIALLFNVGHFYRNYDLGQHILMPIPEVSKNVVNERFSFKGGLSNTMRNILLHLNSPFEEINNLIFSFSKKIHQWMDVDFDDARYTYGKIKDFTVKNHIHEDVSGNFYHFLFLFISFMAIFLSRKKYFNNFYFSFLFFGNLLAFFIFSFYLKWQPWGSRLQLPFFMLAIASVVLLFQDIKTRWRFIVNGIIFFIVFSSSPYLLKNPAKRLISAKKATVWNTSREDMYFVYHERLRKKEYRKIVNYIKDSNCHEIGLFVGEDDWEYPFFALFRKEQYPVHIEHVFVKNASYKYSDFLFSPCAVILKREISEIDRKKNEDFFKLKKYYSDYFELYLKE